MRDTLVVLAVGLTADLIGAHTPAIKRFAERGGLRPLTTVTPAVTCTVQATLMTGAAPSRHGCVANGWYFRDLAEVWLWRQSNHLVGGEKIWRAGKARDPRFTCANMFWWYNMYSGADYGATPRPQYPADGRKIPDHYAYPDGLHDELDERFGQFPLFTFWGPMADISSTAWIAGATRHVMETRTPTLTLCYVPHLDYNLQRLGPQSDHPQLAQDLQDLDAQVGALIEAAEAGGRRVIVVSEYGITPVTDAIPINRALREAGYVAVRREGEREQFDAGASRAFAVADHQIAHIYVNDPSVLTAVKALVERLDGVERVLDADTKAEVELNHPNSGELVAISAPDRWFSYYYWLDDARAPDYARTVDIHRKPGYDPVELFFDPALKNPKLAAGLRLARRKLGFRALMDVISLKDTQLVKGSHGRPTEREEAGPLLISSEPALMPDRPIRAAEFKDLALAHVFD